MTGTSGVNTSPTTVDGAETILSPEALAFLADLHRTFGARRTELLERRKTRRAEIARTGKLDFLAETASIRDDPSWKVAEAPADLLDRRVEITGPTDPKMTINALNSGAKVWLADLEDANTPHWDNVVGGQISLYRATRRELSFESGGKQYQLGENLAVVVTRPRGWHLDEEHVTVDGEPIAGGLVDFGLYFFHNAAELLARGSGPYFYLPKTESHLEARLWNDVFTHSEAALGIPHGTIRATVLIETITAAFEMEEILYELREHASGLNAGRWDYLFSVIKNFRDAGPEFVLPDRGKVTMTAPFMRAYTELLVATCHKRGAFAMGGMAAFIPSRRDPEVNAKALAQVRADKEREAGDGFDGSWVAHPDLVPVCQEVFDAVLGDKPNQLDRLRPDVHVAASDLLDVANTPGDVTEAGVRANVSVALQYLKAWIGGLGAVAINNLMEDAATAEISRSQVWQWIAQGTILDTGEPVTEALVRRLLDEEVAKLGEGYDQARTLFEQVALADEFVDFLTLPAYALVR
ncbi:malate synthase A [Cryptosporangium aurantiacum]|uniref:Malate synthase n=1 Tax=Cryptosporangium aurantiacum TaxID=134849 RepID=A0A1M7QCW5_9ACTN|nr:malate synthase A [Cryptosporangium aurantiacum]SHN28451.1 malate synthase [Cryptosporangium aurantiacum]